MRSMASQCRCVKAFCVSDDLEKLRQVSIGCVGIGKNFQAVQGEACLYPERRKCEFERSRKIEIIQVNTPQLHRDPRAVRAGRTRVVSVLRAAGGERMSVQVAHSAAYDCLALKASLKYAQKGVKHVRSPVLLSAEMARSALAQPPHHPPPGRCSGAKNEECEDGRAFDV